MSLVRRTDLYPLMQPLSANAKESMVLQPDVRLVLKAAETPGCELSSQLTGGEDPVKTLPPKNTGTNCPVVRPNTRIPAYWRVHQHHHRPEIVRGNRQWEGTALMPRDTREGLSPDQDDLSSTEPGSTWRAYD